MNNTSKLSKFQRLLLIYISKQTSNEKRKHIKRTDITKDMIVALDIKEEKRKSFRVVLTNSLNSLHKRGLIIKMRTCIGLTDKGKIVSKEIVNSIGGKCGLIDWDIIADWWCE